MTAKSSSGTCYAIGDSANGPGTVFANLGDQPCDRSQRRRPLADAGATAPTIANATAGGGWAQAW